MANKAKRKSNEIGSGGERRVTRLQSKVSASQGVTPNPQRQLFSGESSHSLASSSKVPSENAHVAPIRCACTTLAKRCKENGGFVDPKLDKLVNESIPTTEEVPHQVAESGDHSSADDVSASINVVINKLLASFSPSASSRCIGQHVKANDVNPIPVMGGKIIQYGDTILAGTTVGAIATANGALSPKPFPSELATEDEGSKAVYTDASPSVHAKDLKVAATTTITSNIIATEQTSFLKDTIASNLIPQRPEKSVSNGNPKGGCLHQSLSFGLTEMANMWTDADLGEDEVESAVHSPALDGLHGYSVKEALVPVLREILEKHGDISMNCSITRVKIRSFFLEEACEIIQTLQEKKFTELTQFEIEEMLARAGELEKVSLQVGWLIQRLNQMLEAKRLIKNSFTLKEARDKSTQLVKEKKKELDAYEAEMLALKEKIDLTKEEMDAAQAEARKINGTISDAKAKVRYFLEHSLLDGLL